MYRNTPQGEQEIATLTPFEILKINNEMHLDESEDIEQVQVLMIYREPVSKIPKLVTELSLHLWEEIEEPRWAGIEERLLIMEHGDTRQEVIEKITEKCKEKLEDLQRRGELEEWAKKNGAPVAKIDAPSSHETGFQAIRWECQERAEG